MAQVGEESQSPGRLEGQRLAQPQHMVVHLGEREQLRNGVKPFLKLSHLFLPFQAPSCYNSGPGTTLLSPVPLTLISEPQTFPRPRRPMVFSL